MEVDYTDVCLTSNYDINKTGEGTTKLAMTTFTETPTDISDGDTLPFTYTISSFENNLPVGTGAHYVVTFDLPTGITWAARANDMQWAMNGQQWVPFTVNHQTNPGKVTAKFAVTAPFNIQKSEITIYLAGDCSASGATAGTKIITTSVGFVPDTSCTSVCEVAMVCSETVTTDLHCPLANCEGFRFLSFDFERISLGQPDNDQNGLPDNSGSLNHSLIRKRRVMVGDTFETTYKALVDTGSSNDYFHHFFVEADIEMGQQLTYLDGELEIYDEHTNTTYLCQNFQVDSVDFGNDRKYRFSFVPARDCASLPKHPVYNTAFYFTHGDSIEFKVRYKVTGNIGGAVQEVKIDNDLFSSSLMDPWAVSASTLSNDKWACDDYNGRFTLIGYYFNNSKVNKFSVTSCSKVIQQDFSMSIGDCCGNYQGGNLFPYEYRHWGKVHQVEVTIPANYEVLTAYAKQRRTKATNSSVTQTVNNLMPAIVNNQTLTYDLDQLYTTYGGTWEPSDDGFSGTFYLKLAPTCDVPINTFENINWKYKFEESAFLGNDTTDWYMTLPDKIRYNPTALELSSTNPIVDGLGRTVKWNLKVKNNTTKSDADNAWIHIKSPSSEIVVDHVVDMDTGDTLSLTSDYFKVGSIQKTKSKNYEITARYHACAPDYITVYSGYECAGYPVDFASFQCSYTTYGLQVVPKSAEPQVTIAGTTIGGNCNNVVEISMEMASVKFAHLDSIEVELMSIGGSMTYIPGSAEIKYPLTSAFAKLNDPSFSANGRLFNIMDELPALAENGLPGVLDLANNRFQLRFQMNLDANFQVGDFAQLKIMSKTICGTPLPVINLAYDPSIQFSENNIAGLSYDASNSWGIAWADYDGDGFEDVFVAEYDKNKSNFLYHNQGDGTFSKIASAPFSADLGSSIGATWGDYDNDGNIDLFVANNIGAKNALYKNNGNASFTKIAGSDVTEYAGYSHGASWVDYNNDGFLDLFVTDFMPTRFNLLYKKQW